MIGGYTAPKGTRSLFGSLVLGYYNEAGQLIYCGNVGTGLQRQTIRTVYEQMKQLEQDSPLLLRPIDDARNRDVQLDRSDGSSPKWNSPTGPKEGICATRPSSACGRTKNPKRSGREKTALLRREARSMPAEPNVSRLTEIPKG